MLFQGKGPETISIIKMPDDFTAIYYINDYKDDFKNKVESWHTSNAVVEIHEPNGGQVSRFVLDPKTGENPVHHYEKYFIVGCFGSSGFKSFKKPSGNPYTAKDPTKLTPSEIGQICG